MGVLVHLYFKNSSGGGVSSPVDGVPGTVWPYDYWAALYQKMSRAGVTVPLLPPPTKGASLGAGLDPFDHYDLGSKNQRGRRQTRYGSVEQARRNVAIANRNGMECAVNVVHHHVDGDSGDFSYQYLGADGKTLNGRFPKDKNCFWTEGSSNPDRVPDPQWDMSFGREFRWMSGTYSDGKDQNNAGYVGRGLIESLEWQLRSLGIKQIFWDDLKGTSANYIAWATNSLRAAGLIDFAFGEYYDGNPNTLYSWIHSYPIEGACGVLDFTNRFALRSYCNSPGNFDMRQLMDTGLIYMDPFNAVTFCEDADTDESGPIMQRVLQACAAISTMTGYPMQFGKDMWDLAGCYGLIDEILTLCWIHEKMANGPLIWRASDYNYLVYERPESPGMLAVLSNKPGSYANPKDWTPITVQTAWWPGTAVKDHTGHSSEIRYVDGNGRLSVAIPPSDEDGRGYACWGQASVSGEFQRPAIRTKQRVYGAADLDTYAAGIAGTYVTKIWCDRETEVSLNKLAGTSVRFEVTDADDNVIVPYGYWEGKTKQRGWHTVNSFCSDEPGTPYELEMEYTGTANLTNEEIKEGVGE